jgi:predicted DCC family thiol-disulfide oxidoreductase YuxK
MNSVSTEITETDEVLPLRGWILYDAECSACSHMAAALVNIFALRGFTFAPLQAPWVLQRLRLSRAAALEEMRVLTREGETYGGATAVTFLARHVWWMWPLHLLAKLEPVQRLLDRLYRWIAAHRSCSIRQVKRSTGSRWAALIVLPLLGLAAKPLLPPWGFMWSMAAAIFFGCKWFTLQTALQQLRCVSWRRSAVYLLAWPGMDAVRFLSARESSGGSGVVRPLLRIAAGVLLLFVVARQVEEVAITGWLGMIGMVLILHFGVFDLLASFWRMPPIMDAPLRSRSISEFWSRRWNGAFNTLALQLVFRPIARRVGAAPATLAAFGVSGLIHELVISLPAGGGYGLPTLYFLAQGAALLVERRVGSSWLFTMIGVAAPAFWLFHPPFVARVILPFMEAIGAR